MLPTLSSSARRLPSRRVVAGIASVALLGLSLAGAVPEPREPAPDALAARLPPASWGIAVPLTWFSAPLGDLRPGDRIDILALRAGERPVANAIAFDLEVMSQDERALVLGVTAFDATAIATARAAGQLIVPLLRSAR